MRFDPALWNDSKPLYAPCTGWTRAELWWKVPKSYRDLGYKGNVKLPGKKGDGRDAERAAMARALTRKMLERYGHGPDAPPDTWSWLIARYKTDEFSPFKEVKANTRAGYEAFLQKWQDAIGSQQIGALSYEAARKIERAMKEKGRSASYIKRMFTLLRIIANYGKAIKNRPAAEACDVLGAMRLRTPPKRNVAPSRGQVMAIVAEADKRGLDGFALGVLMQWHFALRAVDVRGQWFNIEGDVSGVTRTSYVKRQGAVHTKVTRWQDGLTWDMFEPDLSSFVKVVSKTERTMPDPIRFDLTQLPDVQERLARIKAASGIGPVILAQDGLPYTTTGWAQTFGRIRDALGLPKNLWSMDLRAGAITEARHMGAAPMDLRDMANHADLATTNGYVRGRSEAIAKVVKLRTNTER